MGLEFHVLKDVNAEVSKPELAVKYDVSDPIEVRGTTLVYLPSDSPDTNPIDLVFAKLKWLLRSLEARFVADL